MWLSPNNSVDFSQLVKNLKCFLSNQDLFWSAGNFFFPFLFPFFQLNLKGENLEVAICLELENHRHERNQPSAQVGEKVQGAYFYSVKITSFWNNFQNQPELELFMNLLECSREKWHTGVAKVSPACLYFSFQSPGISDIPVAAAKPVRKDVWEWCDTHFLGDFSGLSCFSG